MTRTISTQRVLGVVLAVIVCGFGTRATAQFAPSTQVTDGAGGYTAPEIVRIANDFIAIGTSANGTIYHANTAVGGPAVPELVSPQAQGQISLAAAAGFLEYLVYTQEDSSGGPGERDIRVATNGAGLFTPLVNVTADDIDDRDPQLHFDATGARHVVWVADNAGVTTVRYQQDDMPIEDLGSGDFPAVTGVGGGDVVVTYLRGGDLFSRHIIGTGRQPEVLLLDATAPISEYAVSGAGGILRIATVEAGALAYREGAVGSPLSAPTNLSAGPVVGAPAIDVDSAGDTFLVWAEGGSLLFSKEAGGTFPPAAALPSEAGASAPAVVIDSLDFVHVAYLSGGEVWMTNDVPAPTAEFAVTGGSGVLPVEISLVNSSSGVIQFYEWDFGDGTTSSQQNPLKVYFEPGVFSISLTVRGPGGEDTFTVSNAANTQTPPNVLEIADIIAFSGQPVSQPLLASHPDPLFGFQTAIRYDEGVTPFSEVTFTGTGVASLFPEFVVANINPNGASSELIIAVIFDYNPPFDERTLEAGIEQTIANLIYTVPFGLPLGTSAAIEFVDGLGTPPITNRFSTVNTESIAPYLLAGSCTVDAQPQFIFMRGDANYNLGVDIADAIFMLAFLFSRGPEPVCPDSADANDDGQLNIGDSIYILGFLFANGPTLPYPFPGLGIDPTEDSLDACNPSPNP